MPNGKTYWTNELGSELWVVSPGSIPPARNLQTGAYASSVPSNVNKQFTPSGPYTPEEAQTFPYASQSIEGFPAATGPRAPAPKLPPGVGSFDVPIPPAGTATAATAPSAPGIGEVPPLNPDDFYVKWDSGLQDYVPARPGETGAVFDDVAYDTARKARAGGDPGGPRGPTAAELAIQQSQVQATNLATFISGTVAQLEAEIDAGRLETEQAIGEFNRRLDAFSEAGRQFEGIQPYTIPTGAEFAPGFGPGEIGEQLGIKPRRAEPVEFDPFGMAADIVSATPDLTEIGVPSLDPLQEAIDMARGFL